MTSTSFELPLLGENLTPHSNTRDMLAVLADQYLARSSAFAQSRLTLDAWADTLATGAGEQAEVALTTPGREHTIAELFSGMDRAQACRFLGELFGDIVPHLASQRHHLQDLARGQLPSGAPVKRSNLVARVAAALGAMDPAELDQMTSTTVQSLRWVDDRKAGVESNAIIQMEISEPPQPRPS